MADTPTKQGAEKADGITADAWVTFAGPHSAVLFAGLLADQPNLRKQKLSLDEWQKKLDAYAKSTRV